MHVRSHIKSLQDLENRFSPRFCRRLKRLMRAYKDHKFFVEMPGLLRALNLACAFVLTAEKDMATTSNFYQMLHGEAQETIEIDGSRLLYNDETLSSEENFFWDTTCLLLEESTPEREFPQYAFDIAGRYVLLAYNREVIDDVPVSASAPQQFAAADLLLENQRLREERQALREERQALLAENKTLRDEIGWLRESQRMIMSQLIGGMKQSIGNHTTNISGPTTNNGGTMTGDVTEPRNIF